METTHAGTSAINAVTRAHSATTRASRTSRPHLDELDRLRIITALSVVAVHTLANTLFLNHAMFGRELQDALVTALHYTREIFMFVTALALVYVYYGKPFATGRFWKKRAVAVLIPYAIWTLIYVLANARPTSFWSFSRIFLVDLLTGAASYQLYYILLTLEFYLIFPVFLRALPVLARRPWVTLAASFALELAILVADQRLIPALSLSASANTFLTAFLDRFVLVYQFYFVLGALVAIYLAPIQAFMSRHHVWMALIGVGALAALEAHYVVDVNIRHISLDSAIIVLQPIMAFYSLGCILSMYWLTRAQALRVARSGRERVRRAWRELSDAAFGLYLVHPLVLGIVMVIVAPLMRSWPTAPMVGLIYLLTAGGSLALTLLLLRLPLLSRTVGRPAPTPAWLTRWLNGWAVSLSGAWAGPRPAAQPALERQPLAPQEQARDAHTPVAER